MCAPDIPAQDPAIGQAAAANAEIGKDALAFQKQVYEEGKPRQERVEAIGTELANKQMAGMDQQQALTDQYIERLTQKFFPVEDQLISEASNYDTAGEGERMAQAAGAGIEAQAGSQRAATERRLAGMGVRPGSGNYMGMERGADIATAVTKAGAMGDAREQAKTLGWAKKMDVASLGRGAATGQATSASLALNSGNSAVANAGAGNAVANQNAGQMMTGYGTAIQGNNSAGNILNQQYQNQLAGYGAEASAAGSMASGIGTAAGMFFL